MRLQVPSQKERVTLFKQMDEDQSGELNFNEVSVAVTRIWPQISEAEIKRAFQMAVIPLPLPPLLFLVVVLPAAALFPGTKTWVAVEASLTEQRTPGIHGLGRMMMAAG